jgi:hypothetical protein
MDYGNLAYIYIYIIWLNKSPVMNSDFYSDIWYHENHLRMATCVGRKCRD